MLRSSICLGMSLIVLPLTGSSASVFENIEGPWDLEEEVRIKGLANMMEELAAPKVSGKELACKAEAFRAQWRAYMDERRKMASALSALAAEYEENERFSQALALYEALWEHFPEQQELIGKIKRDRALAEVPLDLSTPESAFLNLKRSLLTYKLTSAALGITDSSEILYEPEPIERHEWEAEMQRLEDLLADTKETLRQGASSAAGGKRKADWPQRVHDPWRKATWYFAAGHPISLKLKNATALQAIEELVRISPVPIMMTAAARFYLAKLSRDQEKTASLLSMDLKNAPASDILQSVLREISPKRPAPTPAPLLRLVDGYFASHVRHVIQDGVEPLLTLVIQNEPCVAFPDHVKPSSEGTSDAVAEWLIEMLGFQEKPPPWFIHYDMEVGIEVMTATPSALGRVLQLVRFPRTWRYYGRVLPLFRCLGAYPLPGPRPDWYGDSKKRYIWEVQLGWQARRMHKFLDDRLAIIMLLGSKLTKAEERAPNRFIPHLDLPRAITSLTSRLGLWYDSKAYRFLLFDSEKDRERWLKGEDWLDMPGDLHDYEWKTSEELKKEAKQLEKQYQGKSITPAEEK